ADRFAAAPELSAAVFDVGAQLCGGERLRRFDQLGGEELHRAPRAVERARAAGAVAHDGKVEVALVDADALARIFVDEAQAFAENAYERGLVALAGGLRHAAHVQDARRVEARVRLVLGRDARGARLEKGRNADAAQLAFALGALAPRGKSLP